MKFNYKNFDFELALMDEPHNTQTFGMIAIFRVKYVAINENMEKIELSKHDDYEFEDYEYINYFCNQEDEEENLKAAQWYIDEYFDQLKRKENVLERALSIIKDYYTVDKDFFEIDKRKEIEQNIIDLEKILNK